MTRMINFRADEAIDERLSRLAERTGRTKTYYVREAVERHIEDLEDAYLADQVMARVERGEEGVKSLEALERELGLAD